MASSGSGLGVGIILGSAALGIGGGVGLGIASEIHGPVTRCFWPCTTSEGVVGHDSAVLGAAIAVGVVGLVAILAAGFGLIMPARHRKNRIHRERRYR